MALKGLKSPKKAVFGRFWSFWTLWGPSGTPIWPSLNRKTVPIHHWGCAVTCSTLVSLCSTSLEPPDPLMAQKGRFWQFWTLWGPSGAPIWPSLTREMVSMHHQGCALTCSTLVPLCSTSLEPLDPLMAQKGRFWLFWTLFGHITGQNGWNKNGAQWNKSILTKTKQKTSWVVMENQLRKTPNTLTHCVIINFIMTGSRHVGRE